MIHSLVALYATFKRFSESQKTENASGIINLILSFLMKAPDFPWPFEIGYMQTIYFQKEADCINLFVSSNYVLVNL